MSRCRPSSRNRCRPSRSRMSRCRPSSRNRYQPNRSHHRPNRNRYRTNRSHHRPSRNRYRTIRSHHRPIRSRRHTIRSHHRPSRSRRHTIRPHPPSRNCQSSRCPPKRRRDLRSHRSIRRCSVRRRGSAPKATAGFAAGTRTGHNRRREVRRGRNLPAGTARSTRCPLRSRPPIRPAGERAAAPRRQSPHS